ncbi:MAG: hypothetical protein IK137_03440 [Bacilli bacterium]|nr:hypothetical protein [Bacilli bacterium]
MGEILLVEPAEAVSENVQEANKLRLDPLSATRLVSTPAQIKGKINAKMSPEGRYLANDQFSEATITDIDGTNLVNNEYYSYVARDKDKLFLAKNNADTDVVEFSIPNMKIIEKEITPVPDTEVKQEVVIPAIETTPVQETVTEPVVENNSVVPSDLTNLYENNDLGENISISSDDNITSFDNIGEETPTVEVDSGDEVVEEIPNETDRETELEKRLSSLNDKFGDMNTLLEQYESKNTNEEINNNDDVFNTSDIKVDTIYDIEDEDVIDYPSIDEGIKEDALENGVKIVNDLMRKYTETSNALKESLDREEKLKSSRRILADKSKVLSQKCETLTLQNHTLEAKISKLESRNETLESKINDGNRVNDLQKREIEELKRENSKLHAQVDSIRDFTDVLADASALINDNDYDNSYQRVA